jgi:hypothetical protein
VPGDEPDEFRTPETWWTAESMGGVKILVTAFLNLVNGDALQRLAPWQETILLVFAGVVVVGVLGRARLLAAAVAAVAFALAAAAAGILGSHLTNYWVPWLVLAGGQVPVAFLWTAANRVLVSYRAGLAKVPREVPPDAPGYRLQSPPIGRGAYGTVWLARNAAGQWHALKAVYLERFEGNTDPYDREYNGVTRYMPFSDKHPGLLPVKYVSPKNAAGYFYYVMELGDSLQAGWQRNPSTYKPRDLVTERAHTPGRKLPVRECVALGLVLTDALEFLHRQGLTHRDIKPQNVIFVDGRPKLADLGLVAETRPPDRTRTYVGTPGYMPPLPELPGTPQADIYALGVVLYVLATGSNPSFFPEISTTLADSPNSPEFFQLNEVILKACNPDCEQRYTSAAEMHRALQEAQDALTVPNPEKKLGKTQ